MVSAGIIFTSAWFYVSDKLSRLETYRESIQKIAKEQIRRGVTFEEGKAGLSLFNGLEVELTRLTVTEKDLSSDFVSVKKAVFRVKTLPLLIKKVVIADAVLEQPVLTLRRDKQGILNIDDLLNSDKKKTGVTFRRLQVNQGKVNYIDRAVSLDGLTTSLEDICLSLNSAFGRERYDFNVTVSVKEGTHRAGLWLKGRYRPASPGRPVYESLLHVTGHLKGMDLEHYNPYLKKYSPIREIAGQLDAEIEYSGMFSNFTSRGMVDIRDGRLIYPQVFRDRLEPRKLRCRYDLSRSTENLRLNVSQLQIDDFEASGGMAVKEIHHHDPLLEVNAATSAFSMKSVRPYIPWAMMGQEAGDFINAHIRDGRFRLTEGKLRGRLSQIADMNKKENAGLLFLRAEVDEGVFVIAPDVPVFHRISGTMEFGNRQFFLRHMKALFGSSPCTLEGRISDYALPGPVVYTADMKMRPDRREILWLLGKERFGDLIFRGPSLLHLKGDGTLDRYRVTADWNLTDAAYRLPDVLEKPSLLKNQLSAEMIWSGNALSVSPFHFDLPPFNITGSVRFHFPGDMPVTMNIQSKNFDLQAVKPVLPFLRTLHPSGNGNLDVTARGILNDPASLQWTGKLLLKNVSLKPPANMKTVRGLSGEAVFKGHSMDTSLLKAAMGRSKIQGRFSVDDFRHPRLTCKFESPGVRSADLGWSSPRGGVRFRDVAGELSIAEQNVHVDRLSFSLGESAFNLSGDINYGAEPQIDLTLVSPYFDTKDIVRLMSMSDQQEKTGSSPLFPVHARIFADAGKIHDIDVKNLSAEFKYASDVIEVEKLEAGLFDGNIKAGGKVIIQADGQNHYEAGISADKMDLKKIQRYLNIQERVVTGALSLQGDVSFAGADVGQIEKSLAGTMKVRAEKGVLKKFSVLSKIFSLLNVYQLFKLQLPDMARDGMPYQNIAARAVFKNGVISSDDFFIDSDAMKISGSGQVDYLHQTLDCFVGIHPLQTVDRLAAVLPIAGWLVTDEKGNLITVPFNVYGEWDNPRVIPIPASSVKKGMLDLLNRFIQLPEKLITDTGEVIFGR